MDQRKEKELKTSSSKFAYKEVLVAEMKEFVDAFYSEMIIKISSIRKEQRREIREKKTQMKYARKRGKSTNGYSKGSTENIA
ncbi:hypothetical protein OS493_032110 [Desmophyllum pertusum]|uniref:Uncharacterized protein n=1 Tax=Desmophyllum pertusum TaxID=174260 RepID=A0A9W9YJG1_9CNID|nr:hypothetical protein OS493_032110 [Desmophyllum pertusum]